MEIWNQVLVIISWATENADSIVACLLGIGALVESVKKAWPTKTDKSALQVIGEFVTKLLSKIPSNTKKESVEKVEENK